MQVCMQRCIVFVLGVLTSKQPTVNIIGRSAFVTKGCSADFDGKVIMNAGGPALSTTMREGGARGKFQGFEDGGKLGEENYNPACHVWLQQTKTHPNPQAALPLVQLYF